MTGRAGGSDSSSSSGHTGSRFRAGQAGNSGKTINVNLTVRMDTPPPTILGSLTGLATSIVPQVLKLIPGL